jgi:DNA polymerase III alpha subunit
MVAYQTAYLKANYPDEFLSAMTQTAVDAELREDTTPGRLSS